MMRRRLLMASVWVGLAGCAASPDAALHQAYDDYWACASQAVRPYVDRPDLTAHAAALKAQNQCGSHYQEYRRRQIVKVRATLASDSYDLADQLGGQEALVWHRRVTRALDDYVRRARAGS